MQSERFIRTKMLIGQQGMDVLKNSRVAVFGAGGVGGYVIEALVRSGIGAIDIVDNDVICESNLNRQIIATGDTIGMYKVDACRERILSINPECSVKTYKCFYLPETSGLFDFSNYTYVVDAIDTVTAKIDIIMKCQQCATPVISCMGTGNKLDPSKLEISDIYKTSVCPLARVMRRELKNRGVKHQKVLYSTEIPVKTGQRTPGSVSFVPPVAGMIIASHIIRELTGNENTKIN